MALGADLLLQGSSAARVATGAGKSPNSGAAAADQAQNGGFAEVYARERETSTTAAKSAAKPGESSRDKVGKPAEEKPQVADTGKELPAEGAEELPPETVQLESLMLFDRSAATAEEPAATLEELPAEPGEAIVAEEAAMTAAMIAPVAQTVVTTAPSSSGRAAATQTLNEQRANSPALTATDPAQSDVTPELADGEARFDQLSRELDAGAVGRATSAVASEVRGETPPGGVNPLTQAVAQANATAGAREAATVMQQPLSLSQNGWSEAVVERVMWLSSQNLKSAEIQLDPAELGRLEVRINLNQELTQVSFSSPHAGVRDALESQLQRLRDMFNQQGMDLVDVNVSDQSLARGERESDARGGGRGIAAGGEEQAEQEDLAVSTTALDSDRGLVDFYA